MVDQIGATADRPAGRSFLRRTAAIITATTVLVAGSAYLYASLATPVYTAHARVLVEPLTLPTAVQRAADMGTEEAVATSSTVLSVAAARLHRSLNTVSDAVSVSVPVSADVLDIGYSSSRPLVARSGATAVAEAYMAYRARTTSTSAANRLSAPGVQTRLVTPAARPATPSSPDVVVDLLAGIVVGLVAGVALAFAWDRFGRRLRSATRWQEITGVPVVVGLAGTPAPDAAPPDGSAAAAAGDAGTDGPPGVEPGDAAVLRQLRVLVGHALPAQAALVVSEVDEAVGGATLGRDLADAFADAGRSAVLLEIATRPRAASVPGGPERLRTRVTVPPAPGAGPRPAGTWQDATVSQMLAMVERYRASVGLVIVVAPPVAESVAALDVAGIADAALLVDHAASSRRGPATRAVAELRAAGCRVCAGVLLGLRPTRVGGAAGAGPAPRDPGPRVRPRPGRLIVPSSVVPSAPDGAPHAVKIRTDSVNGSTP